MSYATACGSATVQNSSGGDRFQFCDSVLCMSARCQSTMQHFGTEQIMQDRNNNKKSLCFMSERISLSLTNENSSQLHLHAVFRRNQKVIQNKH